jgi:hypothetical protein
VGRGLAGMVRPGNAGSNTTADHIAVLDEALAALPGAYRPRPDDPDGPRLLIRSDPGGATHGFAATCRAAGVGLSFGFPVTAAVRDAVATLTQAQSTAAEQGRTVWYPAIEADGMIRDGAWLAEATGLVDLSAWPPRTRLILRKERPHPGAQLTFADQDGHRITAFITDAPIGSMPGQLAGLDLRHRQHARVEDRISPGQGDRAAEPAPPLLRVQQRLAGDRADRDRLGRLVQTHRLRRPARPRPLRDQHLPLPGPARRRPDQPRRPTDPAADRPNLAMATAIVAGWHASAPPSPDPQILSDDPKDQAPAVEPAATRADTRLSKHPNSGNHCPQAPLSSRDLEPGSACTIEASSRQAGNRSRMRAKCYGDRSGSGRLARYKMFCA